MQDHQTEVDYLVIPQVSSSRRKYIPIGYVSSKTVVSNAVYIMPSTGLYEFGILSSTMHNVWMRRICGRLKSDYRWSPAVYNSMSLPKVCNTKQDDIENTTQNILEARLQYPDKSFAELYDSDKMPDDLLAAHKANDAAVEEVYGVDFNGDEEKIVAHLFKLYAEKAKKRNSIFDNSHTNR